MIMNHASSFKRSLEAFFIKKFLGAEKLLKDFEFRTKNFNKSQEVILDKIINKSEGTKWGRDHDFSKLNYKTWKSMPVISYVDVEPYINRIKIGDFYALTPEPPESFAITSGTTSEPKFIPLTASSIKNQGKASNIWNISLSEVHGSFLDKLLVLTGSSVRKNPELIPVRSYTDIVKEKQPRYVQRRMVFPKETDFISDYEHRLLIAAQQAFIKQPTTLISVNPATILKLLELTDRNREVIQRATINGKYVGTNINLCKIKQKEKILDDIANKSPLESIKVIGTWLGGTQHLFIDNLRKKGMDVPMRDLGYIATEGRFTVPLEDNSPGGVLNPFGNYYEFMTLDKKNIVPLGELEEENEYNIIITSQNGLYRYDMEDIIKVEGKYNSTPIISFRRKDLCFSSLIGEKIHENHVLELFKKLKAEKGFLIARINPPHYDLCLNSDCEFKEVLNSGLVDCMLQEINPEYLAKRTSNRLGQLDLKFLGHEEFKKLDNKINPLQEHDRFKRKYLVPYGVLENSDGN